MIAPLYKEIIKDLLVSLKPKKGMIITDHYFADVLQITDKNMVITDGVSHEITDENDLIKSGYIS